MWSGPIPSNLSDSRVRATNFQAVKSRLGSRCGPGLRASSLDERSRKQLARACRLECALPRGAREGRARDPWALDLSGTLLGGSL